MHCTARSAIGNLRSGMKAKKNRVWDVANNEVHEKNDVREPLPEADIYDPFVRSFESRKREDPLLRLYDKKIVSDDF
jgi:hypothetical protein